MSTLTLQTIEQFIETKRKEMIDTNSFYKRLESMKSPADFQWCNSLYHLSKEFANLLKLRYEHFNDVPHDVFVSHYEEEKDHAEMLRQWMLANGMDDPENYLPTPETDDFISLQYRASVGFDQNFSLLSINSVGEGTAFDFYNQVNNHLKELTGFATTEYWAVHCEADEEHSNVYHLFTEMTEDELEKAKHYAVYTFNVVNRMIESWK
ncbi:iron-containing redox enzyme family protein [Brevibacillus sp. NPDC058079]|uniref:iron-containing redox enzyme family protein n=1 Tax=Brevibacillus sp. NPDC058079 TaxID=3346330 RepID=UPI0036EA9C21